MIVNDSDSAHNGTARIQTSSAFATCIPISMGIPKTRRTPVIPCNWLIFWVVSGVFLRAKPGDLARAELHS